MKKAFLLLLPFFFLPALVSAGTLTVCPECRLSSLKQAIGEAHAGDRIIVRAGTYRETPVIVDKPLVIIGEGYPVFEGEKEKEILVIAADNVTVEGLQLQNLTVSYLKDLAAIRVQRKKNFAIRNNRLVNTFFGIYLEYASDGIVEGNTIIGKAREEASSGNGIHAWYCQNLRIFRNTVKGHRDGIYFEFVDHSTVINNQAEDNLRYGLHFMFSNNDSYAQNVFRKNGAGVAVMFSKKIDMRDNLFEHNWGRAAYGLLLKEIYDAEIENNRFLRNTIGIYLEGTTRVNYIHNEFRNNGWAVKLAGGCLDNVFTRNNFQTNSLDLVIDSKVNNNTFNGNFWSDYTGYDLDRNGIGDKPHRPVKLFSFILNRSPEAIVLLRSLFIDLLNFSEKVSPVFTPADVLDQTPLMKPLL